MLRLDMPLVGGLPEPLRRLGVILRHPMALGVQEADHMPRPLLF